jgi:hypothetical protein
MTACRRSVSADLEKDIFAAAVLGIDRQIGSPRLSGRGTLVSQGNSVHMKPGNDKPKNGKSGQLFGTNPYDTPII